MALKITIGKKGASDGGSSDSDNKLLKAFKDLTGTLGKASKLGMSGIGGGLGGLGGIASKTGIGSPSTSGL